MKKMITELDYLRTAYKFAMERIEDLEEENRKLKLHIEAKDKAYMSLLKDFDEMRTDMKELKTDYDRLKRAFNDVLYDK